MSKSNVRMWALMRRIKYGVGFLAFWLLIGVWVYFANYYVPANCFDGILNGEETYVDAGGPNCVRLDPTRVIEPTLVWAKSFEVVEGQYNSVAYIENKNQTAATPELNYKFELLNDGVVVAERAGTTILPPNSVYPVFEGRIRTEDNAPVTETRITLQPADMWIPASISRNQFRSADIDLAGADSKPRLNVEVENTELTSADNVEVVATVFSENGVPLTASQTFIERIEARSSQDIVFTWPNSIAKTIRSCIIPTDVTVAIDLSGSMNNDGGDPPQPVTSALQAAGQFVNSLNVADQVSLVTFATQAAVVRQLNNNHSAVANSVSSLAIDPVEEVGYTNTTDALLQAQAELNSVRHNEDARRVLVLLTDGLPTAKGDEDVITPAKETAALLKEDGIEIYAIGLGQNVDQSFINSIATDLDNAYFAPTGNDLSKIYTEITSSLCESGPAKIDVIAKTKTNFEPLR